MSRIPTTGRTDPGTLEAIRAEMSEANAKLRVIAKGLAAAVNLLILLLTVQGLALLVRVAAFFLGK